MQVSTFGIIPPVMVPSAIRARHSAGDSAPRFGYQFTVFRVGVLPTPPDLASDWASQMLFMGHAVLTTKRFFTTERAKEKVEADSAHTNRMLGLAFQQHAPLRVLETASPPTVYIPRSEVATEYLRPAPGSSPIPARSFRASGWRTRSSAAWSRRAS